MSETLDRKDELEFLTGFATWNCMGLELDRDQLRCLWTAYCLHYDMEVDTAQYDNDLLKLWQAIENNGETDTADWSDYDSFDLFMCKYLC